MPSRFGPVVVPVDPRDPVEGSRALPLGAALARRAGVPLEIIAVVDLDEDPAAAERRLRRYLDSHAGAQAEGGRAQVVVAVDADPARAITGHLADHPGALAVMATHARGPLVGRLLGSVAEGVMAGLNHPVVLVGPEVDATAGDVPATLVVGVGEAPAEPVVAGLAAWHRSFGAVATWLLEVTDPNTAELDERSHGDLHETSHLRAMSRLLDDAGIPCDWDVIHDRRPAEGLIRYVAGMPSPLLVVASERWTDPTRRGFGSTARAVAHRSPYPVLVLPVHRVRVG